MLAAGAPPQIGSPQIECGGMRPALRRDRLASSSMSSPSPACQRACSMPSSNATTPAPVMRRQAAARCVRGAPSAGRASRPSCRACAGSLARVPIEHGGIARLSRQRIGDFVAVLRHRPRANSRLRPLRTASASSPLEIAEKRERLGRAPLLAHEQQRRRRLQQQHRERGRERFGSASAVSRSPSGRLPIWSWFCRKLTKAARRQMRARLAARLAARDAATARPDRRSPRPACARYVAGAVAIVAVIAVRLRRSAARARRGGSRRSTARDSCRAAARRADRAGSRVVVVLQHEMDVPAAVARERADRFAELGQDIAARRASTIACTASSRSPSKR